MRKKSQSPKKQQIRRPSKDGGPATAASENQQRDIQVSLPKTKPSNGESTPASHDQRTDDAAASQRPPAVPVVGIGASAGGLEAFSELLKNLPTHTGLAYIYVQHLDPKHESILSELLGRSTSMPVRQVKDGMRVERNTVYIIPPNANMTLTEDGELRLSPRVVTRGQHMPIDAFFRSLADAHKSSAIGVILSGTGTDGALGLEAIKGEGGFTFAQEDSSAKYPGMPRSAVETGMVDFILTPDEIAKELARVGRHPYFVQPQAEAVEPHPGADAQYTKILSLLRARTAVDFTQYRQSTIKRRIGRRMMLRKFDRLDDYYRMMQNTPTEVGALYQEMLINVTSFFRDPEAFDALKSVVFPSIMGNRSPEDAVRIWVPGCASGEEVYTIAICLLEYLGEMVSNTEVQIFATDISDVALDKARSGIYLENISQDVSPERLHRFFVQVNGNYQISKVIRDMCIFARQNVFKDPPFSKLDLISCRNLLIYLEPALQKKVLPVFHYALKPNGYLFLGNSETIGSSDAFMPVEKKHRVYGRREIPARVNLEFIVEEDTPKLEVKRVPPQQDAWTGLEEEANRVLLRYAPPAIIVNEDMEILQFRGHTGKYLEPATGRASLNLLKMSREGLLLDLRATVQKAKGTNVVARKEGIRVKQNGGYLDVAIDVIPVKTPHSTRERYFVVLFEDRGTPESKSTEKGSLKGTQFKKKSGEAHLEAELRRELGATKEYLQSIIEEQEATNEELKSANEELLSSNEELQSTNEERETAKEELQSTNEELQTVNEELQNRNVELSQVNSDLTNLLRSVNIAVIIISHDLRIRRFTPLAEKLLNLLPSDLGRPITDLRPNISIPNLEQLVHEVVDTVTMKEMTVQDHDGHWYVVKIRPYKTAENRIDGTVISLMDIDELRRVVADHDGGPHSQS